MDKPDYQTPDYQTMDLKELYRYMLDHRDDNEAFYAYVDRSKAAGRVITIDPTDPNWEEKMIRDTEKRLIESGELKR